MLNKNQYKQNQTKSQTRNQRRNQTRNQKVVMTYQKVSKVCNQNQSLELQKRLINRKKLRKFLR